MLTKLVYQQSRRTFLLPLLVALFLTVFLSFSTPARAETTNVSGLQVQQLLDLIAKLQAQILALQVGSESSSSDSDISVGDKIQTTSNLKVRSEAGLGGITYGFVPAYSYGKVIDGPRNVDGYTWWKIDYENNFNIGYVGWSVEDWLKKPSVNDIASVKVANSIATCSITTNKSSYILGEEIKINWTSKNAEELHFVEVEGKDGLELTSKELKETGSYETEADVIGLPAITIEVADDDGNINSCSRTIKIEKPSVELRANGSNLSSISVDGEDNESVMFTYHPKGEIDSCTVTGHYTDDNYEVEQAWGKWLSGLGSNEYGRVYYLPIDVHGILEKVVVICDTNYADVSDMVSVSVSGNYDTVASYKIKLNGVSIVSGTGLSRNATLSLCYKEANDYETHNFNYGDVLECYWDGELIYEQDGWKG